MLRPQPAEEGEESIDEYMNRLLQRVHAAAGSQGQEKQPSEPSEPLLSDNRTPATVEVPAAAIEPSATQVARPPAQRPSQPPRQEPGEMSPRAVAPEKSADLSAMRDLANVSAHSALDQHNWRQKVLTRRTNMLMSIMAMGIAGALLAMWWGLGANDITLYAAMVSFVVALYWGFQYLELAVRMMFSRPARQASQSSGDEQLDEEEVSGTQGTEPDGN